MGLAGRFVAGDTEGSCVGAGVVVYHIIICVRTY